MLARRHVRRSKYDSLCDEVDLVSVNPTNARIRYSGGREDTVSLRDLAPLPVTESNAKNPSTGSAVRELPPVPAPLPRSLPLPLRRHPASLNLALSPNSLSLSSAVQLENLGLLTASRLVRILIVFDHCVIVETVFIDIDEQFYF